MYIVLKCATVGNLQHRSDLEYVIPRPLSDIEVMWAWAGKGVMSMGNGDFEESYR